MRNNESVGIEFSEGAIVIRVGDAGELQVDFDGIDSLDEENMERLIKVYEALSDGSWL